MNVLLITVRSDFGGGPRHVDQLIDNLGSDIQLFLAYPKNGDPYGIKWDSSVKIKKKLHIPYRKFSIRTLFQLKKFITENDIQIIHSHGNGAGFYSRMLKVVGIKRRVIHTFHGISDNNVNPVKKIIIRLFSKFFTFFTNDFVFVSEGEKNLAQKLNYMRPKDSIVIYNGIDYPKEKTKDNNVFNVVTLSRFDYQKNMDLAYNIAARLKNEDIKFVWVGNGDDFQRLKEKALLERVNIDFIGFSNEPMKYLADSSLYLTSSRFEGLPYALIEAASVGLPIIATNVIGNNEVVKDSINGYLYESIDDACNKIMELKNNQTKLHFMGQNSISIFEELFSIKKMLSKITDLYKKDC